MSEIKKIEEKLFEIEKINQIIKNQTEFLDRALTEINNRMIFLKE